MSEVYVVCGGPSLIGFDFEKLRAQDVIVVNKSIVDVPWAKYFITMDFTFLAKVPKECLSGGSTKVFVANFAPEYPYMAEVDGRIVDTRFNTVYTLNAFAMIIKSKRLDGLGTAFYDFRSGENSGFCAFQLAVLLGYDKINLLGVDLVVQEGKTHYHGGYGGPDKFKLRLPAYVRYWEQGVRVALSNGIEVVSRSNISILNDLVPYRSW